MSDSATLRRQIDALQRQLQALQTPMSTAERDALAGAQHRADSMAAQLGMGVSPPRLGESSLEYRRRTAASFQHHSPALKNARLDSADSATLGAAEDRIYADAVSAARNGSVGRGQLREVQERDESGRLIRKYYGDPMVWMAPFMSQGQSGKIVQKPNADR